MRIYTAKLRKCQYFVYVSPELKPVIYYRSMEYIHLIIETSRAYERARSKGYNSKNYGQAFDDLMCAREDGLRSGLGKEDVRNAVECGKVLVELEDGKL